MWLKKKKMEDMKGINMVSFGMVLELSIIVKVENIVENGLKIKCKVEEFSTTKTSKLPMKENGVKISFKAMEFSIMKK